MNLAKPLLAPILTLTLLAALAGCGGGGSSSTSTTTSTTSTATSPQKNQKQTQTKQKGSKQGGSQQTQQTSGSAPTDPNPLPNQGTGAVAPGVPTAKGGDNSIQTYGTEAPVAERVAVAAAVKGYFEAMAAGNWAKACTYLRASTQRKMARAAKKSPRIKGSGCGATLAALLGRAPKSLLRANAPVRVLSLRSKGTQAFVVYRAANGKYYNMPLRREGSAWKITSFTGIQLMLGSGQ